MLGERVDSANPDTYYKFQARLYGRYWRIDPNGGELYVASNRPHLKRVAMHDRYGYYPEDKTLGGTEEAFCHMYSDLWVDGWPEVVVPLYPPPEGTWQHVGKSWQKKGY